MVRHCSAQFGLNSSRIGVLSFSFATLVAAFLANRDGTGDRLYKPVDEMDQASFKLDFLLGIYPTLLPVQEYFKQNNSVAPPTFFALANDDPVIREALEGRAMQHLFDFVAELRRQGDPPTELH